MDLSNPITGIFPSADAKVLKVLAGTTEANSGRKVADLAGIAHTSATKILERLADNGVVLGSSAGNARLYVLNRDHVASEAIEQLAFLRPRLFRMIAGEIEAWKIKPEEACVFGSAARGDGNTDSDIDILLVHRRIPTKDLERWEDQLDDLRSGVLAWSGNHAGLMTVELDEWRHSRGSSETWSSIEADAIAVYGRGRIVSTWKPAE